MVRTVMALGVAALLAPLAALAQTTTTQTTTTYENPEQFNPGPKPSVAVMGLVGVNGYARGIAAEMQTGVGYGAGIDLSPIRNIGIEIQYVGALNDVVTSTSTDGRLVSNQIGANLRLNLVPATHDLPGHIRPFVYGGAAYQNVLTQNFTPGLSTANALAVPVGGGIEGDIGDVFLVGARFAYNFLFYETSAFSGRSSDDWTASINIGGRFSGGGG